MRFLVKEDKNNFVLLRDGTVEKSKDIVSIENNSVWQLKLEKKGKINCRFYTGRGKIRYSKEEGKDIIQICSYNVWE